MLDIKAERIQQQQQTHTIMIKGIFQAEEKHTRQQSRSA